MGTVISIHSDQLGHNSYKICLVFLMTAHTAVFWVSTWVFPNCCGFLGLVALIHKINQIIFCIRMELLSHRAPALNDERLADNQYMLFCCCYYFKQHIIK